MQQRWNKRSGRSDADSRHRSRDQQGEFLLFSARKTTLSRVAASVLACDFLDKILPEFLVFATFLAIRNLCSSINRTSS